MRDPSFDGSIPSTRSVPSLRGLMHEIMRMVDVLPAPLGPRKPNDSPLAIVKSTPSTATKSPKRFTRLWASTIGAGCNAPSSCGSGAAIVPSASRVGVGASSVVGEEYDVTVSHDTLHAGEGRRSRPGSNRRQLRRGDDSVDDL